MSTLPYEQMLAQAKRFIETHDDFLVVSHLNPDGDAISSTCGIGWLLDKLGKRYEMMNEDRIPPKFEYMWGQDRIAKHAEGPAGKRYRSVISVDCADFARIGTVSGRFAEDARLLNIDHHPTNDFFGDVQVIQPTAAATAEILYDLISLFDVEWDRDIATIVYTGLLTDTGGFRYSNTTPNVLRIASDLLSFGVSANELAEELLERLTYSQYRLLKLALNSLEFSESKRISWVKVTRADIEATGASASDLEGLVNYPRNIEGVEVGMLFKEQDERKVKVSFRSSGNVDVSEVAKSFGGGGHVRAAGATVEAALDEAVERVVKRVEKELR